MRGAAQKKTVVQSTPIDGRRAQMAVMVSQGLKIESMRALKHESEAEALLRRFAGKTPLQEFPDSGALSIPHLASVHCMNAPAQCELEFVPIESWETAFGTAKGEASGGSARD